LQLLVKIGKPGKDKILFKAGGSSLVLPGPAGVGRYFNQHDDVTVQLINDGGGCWESVFAPGAAVANTSTLYKAKR
jgi:hypothetical protein